MAIQSPFDQSVLGWPYTVNSLMFVGINVRIFETRPCARGLTFAVSTGLVNYLSAHELYMFAHIYFCDLLLDGREFRQ